VRLLLTLAVALSIVSAAPVKARADEIRIWTARALATVLAEVGSDFERATGHKLVVSSDLPPAFLRRAEAGEPFDLLISGSSPVDEWIRDGRVRKETRTEIARSGIGVEVKAGAPKPDLTSVDAFKRALLDAKSIAYLRVGSGIYLADLFQRLGIADVELGMTVITQILTTPGVQLAGPLPPEIQSYITFVAAVSSTAKVPDAARQLIAFLKEPAAITVITTQGMQPIR
jgi:molybdate transport system substrate-binding protein